MKLALRWTVRVVWDGSETTIADGFGYTPESALAALRRQAEFKQREMTSEAGKYENALDLLDTIDLTPTTDAFGVLQEEPTGPRVEAHPEPRKETRT